MSKFENLKAGCYEKQVCLGMDFAVWAFAVL